MSKALQSLRESLFATSLVQPISSGGRGGSVFCLCRQLPGQEKGWIQVVDQLLTVAEEKGLDVHVCRRYVRRESRMVFGWYVGVEAKNAKGLVEAVDALTPILNSSSSLRDESPQVPSQSRPQVAQVIRRAPPVEGTAAPRRAPEVIGPDPQAPRGAPKVAMVRISNEVEEMPLPHTYTEMNVPKPGSNRGAALTTKSGELFKGINTRREG